MQHLVIPVTLCNNTCGAVINLVKTVLLDLIGVDRIKTIIPVNNDNVYNNDLAIVSKAATSLYRSGKEKPVKR